MGIFASLKKSRKLRQSYKKLNINVSSVDDLLNSHHDEALDELCDLCEADSNVIMVMKKCSISREKLKELYGRMSAMLCVVGPAEWTKDGHYVPASSIAYIATLDYLLRHENDANFREVASRVYSYFENGEMTSFIN